jgi:hypothetical protein
MPRQNLMNIILAFFPQGTVRTFEEVVQHIRDEYPIVSETEFKSAVLGLLRRGDLVLTDNFNLTIPGTALAA